QEFAKLLAAAPPAGWETAGAADTWAAQWASEIMPLAVEAHQRLTIRKGSKPSPFSFTGGCTWETTLDPAYEDWAKSQARIQVAEGVLRVAGLLKAFSAPCRAGGGAKRRAECGPPSSAADNDKKDGSIRVASARSTPRPPP